MTRFWKKNLVCFFLLFTIFGFSAEYTQKSLDYAVNGNIAKLMVPRVGEITLSYDPLEVGAQAGPN